LGTAMDLWCRDARVKGRPREPEEARRRVVEASFDGDSRRSSSGARWLEAQQVDLVRAAEACTRDEGASSLGDEDCGRVLAVKASVETEHQLGDERGWEYLTPVGVPGDHQAGPLRCDVLSARGAVLHEHRWSSARQGELCEHALYRAWVIRRVKVEGVLVGVQVVETHQLLARGGDQDGHRRSASRSLRGRD